MEILIRIINLYFFFFVGKLIFRLVMSAKQQTKKDNPKVNSEPLTNRWQEKVQKVKEESKMYEMVKDEVCGSYVQKEKAYQVVEEHGTQYFCSWDCRQKYIDQKNN